MEITSFTASRRVGFTVPAHAFDAVCAYERALTFHGLTGPTLADALSRAQDVLSDSIEIAIPERTIYVDVLHDPSSAAITEETARGCIAEYALAALAIAAVAPDLLDQLEDHHEIVLVDDNYVLTSSEQGVEARHFRNGVPVVTELGAAGENLVAGIFDGGMNEAQVRAALEDMVPVLSARTRGSPDDLLLGHRLEGLVPVGRYGVSGSAVEYADRDLVVVSDRRGQITAHFFAQDRYGIRIYRDEQADRLVGATSLRGIDPEDDANPVRAIIREAVDFDLLEERPLDAEHVLEFRP